MVRALATWEDVLVLRVAGEVDLLTVRPLRKRLYQHVPGAYPVVVLDFTAVSFLGACGIGLLVDIAESALAAEITLRLVAPSRAVQRPLEVTGVDALLPPTATVLKAVSDLTDARPHGSRLVHHTEVIALNDLLSYDLPAQVLSTTDGTSANQPVIRPPGPLRR
jgi:anti-anti-sigma factor